MEELLNDYFEYLIVICRLDHFNKYMGIFKILNEIPFRWTIYRDKNREEDGAYLRMDFDFPNKHYDYLIKDFYNRNCSVFEMMVALAIRIDNEYIGDPSECHPEIFFIDMFENLGLDRISRSLHKEEDTFKVIDRWLDRRFTKKGIGSPFPVRRDHRDQRKLEIWDQVMAYINENY